MVPPEGDDIMPGRNICSIMNCAVKFVVIVRSVSAADIDISGLPDIDVAAQLTRTVGVPSCMIVSERTP
jgi:hypothetical protein